MLVTLGVIVVLFAGYELKFTDWLAHRDQQRLRQQVAARWAARNAAGTAPPVAVSAGEGLAVLRIPRLGRTYAWVVVEGTSRVDLRAGPGHLPGTALPGQPGNVVISGHRTTYGHPFRRLDELVPGDPVDVEVRDRVYRYQVTRSSVVNPDDVAVTRPDPPAAGAAAVRLLTLTTCTPPFSATHRLVVRAVLAGVRTETTGGG